MIQFMPFRFHTLEVRQLLTSHKSIISCEKNNILRKQTTLVDNIHVIGIFQV